MSKLAILFLLGAVMSGCAPTPRTGAYGDQDRDGIANRADKDRDGDRVRNSADRRPSDPTRY